MKKNKLKIINVIVMVTVALSLAVTTISTAQDSFTSLNDKEQSVSAVTKLENILFEKLAGKERINLIVSQQPTIKAEGQVNGGLLIKLEDTTVAENLRRSLGDGQLNNVVRVTPSERKINGKQWVYLTIDIKNLVPYSIKQAGKNVLIDFNITGLPERKIPTPVVETAETKKHVAAATMEAPKAKQIVKEDIIKYGGKKISIDFQNADIKSVFRLMSEYGNVNIVSGDDVKGNVTLSMKNVSWEHAFDTILDINGLDQRKVGNVITVITLAKKEETRQALAAQGKLRQILIEAKIVEASEEFSRTLGIHWGGGGNQHIGSWGSSIAGGTTTINQYKFPNEITALDYTDPDNPIPFFMNAINLASLATPYTGPALGFVIGKGASFIEAQLRALESTAQGKIISSPKVITMEDVKAVIKQGTEVPYVIPEAGDKPPNVEFKDALLKLEVTPRITEDGKISMDIKASNDRADWAGAVWVSGYRIPPILTNAVESQVVIQDGDTVVIGGVTIEDESKSDEGVPWLGKIPILGYLFKQEDTSKDKKQLLIFVTPKILTESHAVMETADKSIN